MRVAFFKELLSAETRFHPLISYYLGFSSLVSSVRQALPGVEIRTVYTEEALVASRPDVIGLSVATEMWPRFRELVARLKEGGFDGLLMVGGPHITALPETLPPGVD